MRAVVVGTGFIGPVHVEALRRAGVEVAGIVGSTPGKSKEAAERLGLETRILTFDDALRDDRVDAIHLTTPNRFHFEQASAALRAGKHVMCEKPLAMNARESAELVRIAAGSGRGAGVAYNIRFYPLCHEARARLRSASAGALLHATGSYVQDWLLNDSDFNWRVLAEEGGELRAMADVGTHWLDLVQFITGQKVTEVCADLRTVHPQRRRPRGGALTFSGAGDASKAQADQADWVPVRTDDCGGLLLRFANGANGCFWASQTTAGRKNRVQFEIATERQTLAWESDRPNEMWLGRRDQNNALLLKDPSLMDPSAAAITSYPGQHNEGYPDTFKQLFLTFYGYIERGDYSAIPPFPTFADGHDEIVLCEAILKSHRRRGWVEVERS